MTGKNLTKLIKQLLSMFCMLKRKNIYPAYVSKHNSNCEKQVILFMILNEEKCKLSRTLALSAKSEGYEAKSKRQQWHYVAVKKLSALLREITSKNNIDFYCLNCLHSCRTKGKLESHKKACENKDFYKIIITSVEPKVLEFVEIKNWIKHHLLFMLILNL